jgi:hypothetical protein
LVGEPAQCGRGIGADDHQSRLRPLRPNARQDLAHQPAGRGEIGVIAHAAKEEERGAVTRHISGGVVVEVDTVRQDVDAVARVVGNIGVAEPRVALAVGGEQDAVEMAQQRAFETLGARFLGARRPSAGACRACRRGLRQQPAHAIDRVVHARHARRRDAVESRAQMFDVQDVKCWRWRQGSAQHGGHFRRHAIARLQGRPSSQTANAAP